MVNVTDGHHAPAKALDLFCSRQCCRVRVEKTGCFLIVSGQFFFFLLLFFLSLLLKFHACRGSLSFVADPLRLQKSVVANMRGTRQCLLTKYLFLRPVHPSFLPHPSTSKCKTPPSPLFLKAQMQGRVGLCRCCLLRMFQNLSTCRLQTYHFETVMLFNQGCFLLLQMSALVCCIT